MTATSSAKSRYQRLQKTRQSYVDRARKCAALTIPSLMPPTDGETGGETFATPYQSVGARGVNNIAAKLLISLFPTNTAHFQMTVDEMTADQIAQRPGMKTEIDKALSKIPKRALSHMEQEFHRVPLGIALKYAVVTGNALLHIPRKKSEKVRVFRLDQYVVKRDRAGTDLEIVVEEKVARETVPERVQALLPPQTTPAEGGPPDDEEVTIYTYIWLDGSKYRVRQEVNDIVIPGTIGTYPVDEVEWLPIRFTPMAGEDYGRSYVEEYYGDLFSLETISKALDEAAQNAAMVRFFKRPGSPLRVDKLSKAANGSWHEGSADDVSVLQLDKYADLQVAQKRAAELEQRLAYAFLLNTAIQRPGERVTAEEIRYMARELEDSLGGLYTHMSAELQLPYTKLVLSALAARRQLPTLPKEIRPTIVAGLEAIGRGQDLHKQDLFLAGIAESPAAAFINWRVAAERRGLALGIDMDGLLKTEEEVQQEQQAAQQAAMIEKLGPNVVNQAGNLMKEGMNSGS